MHERQVPLKIIIFGHVGESSFRCVPCKTKWNVEYIVKFKKSIQETSVHPLTSPNKVFQDENLINHIWSWIRSKELLGNETNLICKLN